MKTGAIIFSRIDSKRLPGKALIDIEGRTLLERVIDRTKKIDFIDEIIVATTFRDIDKEIVEVSKKNNVSFFRGNVNNVLLRALNTCKKFNLTKFVRICGDRPFFDPFLVSKLIKLHNQKNCDLVTTMFPKTLPAGLTVEIIKSSCLHKANQLIDNDDYLEHITKYFYQNPESFSILNHEESDYKNLQNISFVVDNVNDLNRTKWIIKKMHENNFSLFNMKEIISFSRQWSKKLNEK